MDILKWIKGKPKRQPNISVYVLSAIVDGNALSQPFGVMPRFADDDESAILKTWHKDMGPFINHQVNDAAMLLSVHRGTIDAVCFLVEEQAISFAGIRKFSEDDLKVLSPGLTHFPKVVT